MVNVKVIIEYDGSNYSGWQVQNNTDMTIQGILEESISNLNKKKVNIIGSGRTDAGVHALGQVANFYLDVDIPIEKIPDALNSLLPPDIVCKDAKIVNNKFHARYDVYGKMYRYRINNSKHKSVFSRNYVYNIYRPLDISSMERAMLYFLGKHDFSAFQASGGNIVNTIREIEDFSLTKNENEWWFEIAGTGFLYKMVRIIMGTLIEVGLGKREINSLPLLFYKKRIGRAGFTAPAKGLTLVKVYY